MKTVNMKLIALTSTEECDILRQDLQQGYMKAKDERNHRGVNLRHQILDCVDEVKKQLKINGDLGT